MSVARAARPRTHATIHASLIDCAICIVSSNSGSAAMRHSYLEPRPCPSYEPVRAKIRPREKEGGRRRASPVARQQVPTPEAHTPSAALIHVLKSRAVRHCKEEQRAYYECVKGRTLSVVRCWPTCCLSPARTHATLYLSLQPALLCFYSSVCPHSRPVAAALRPGPAEQARTR